MDMLIATFRMVGASPVAWGAIGLGGLVLTIATLHWGRCPFLAERHGMDAERARALLTPRFRPGPRFALSMLVGIAAVLGGLGMIAESVWPAEAFCLLLAGVVLIQTQPLRLQLRVAKLSVAAAAGQGPAARAAAHDRLRSAHIRLVGVTATILILAVAALLAF